MKIFEKEGDERAAIYTGLLTVKGKTIFDAIIAKPRLASQSAEDMEYWVDVHEEDVAAFTKHLKRFAMRKNIQIDDISSIIKTFSVQQLKGLSEC